MKLFFKKNERDDIEVHMSKGTSIIEFDYIEMLKQLSIKNEIECDWDNVEGEEKSKLNELLEKIKEAVASGLARPLT